MPKNKKSKNAASRKDIFYKRAKEQGYRARSAFKLVHINNLYGLLKNTKVCIDLCAAPGSWMQIAREYMPTGSVIVGVDLIPIKPIPGTIGIKGDITTESLRSELRSTLQDFKADIVLHDGAPNVGNNWAQDAYDQNVLVLHAFKLACEFLNFGGHFITKVFRSKDSPSLEYVFKALFAKVECTKPQSSRHESAEIFYVCRYFKLKKGDKADPKYFDAKEVFREVDPTLTPKINIYRPEKTKAKAHGYEDGVEILHKETTITEFVTCENFVESLAKSNQLVFDDDKWLEHPSTNQEIISCCEDIKVLGRKDIKMLLSWRKRLRRELDEEQQIIDAATKSEEVSETQEDEEEAGEDEVDKVMRQCEELQEEQRKDDKKKERAIRKQKRSLQQSLRMMAMSGSNQGEENTEFFNITEMEKVKDVNALMEQYDILSDDEEKNVKTKKYLKYKKGDHEIDETGKFYRKVGDVSESESEDEVPDVGQGLFVEKKKTAMKKSDGFEVVAKEPIKKSVRFAADSDSEAESDAGMDEEEEDGVEDARDSDEERAEGTEKYTTDLMGDDPANKKIRTAESWFSQDIFKDIDEEVDEDLDLDAAVENYKQQGGKIYGEKVEEKSDEEPTKVEQEDKNEEKKVVEDEKSKAMTSNEERKMFNFVTKQQLKSLSHLKSELDQLVFPGKIQSITMSDARPVSELEAHIPRIPDINNIDMSNWGEDAFTEEKVEKRFPDLDAVGLAVAAAMIKTKKTRREFELSGWNRFMKGEEPGLPAWFVEDEANNMTPMNVDVDPEEVKYYKAREMAVNARTIKKVMEARVRKQRRFKKTMSKIIKKTEAMQGSSLLSDYEKQQEIKNMYKKALKTKAKKTTEYVVMSKKNLGKAPKGLGGKYKMVDPRLKKDVRARMKLAKKKKTMGRGKK